LLKATVIILSICSGSIIPASYVIRKKVPLIRLGVLNILFWRGSLDDIISYLTSHYNRLKSIIDPVPVEAFASKIYIDKILPKIFANW